MKTKGSKHNSSPKSAHHAMGLEADHFNEDFMNKDINGGGIKKEDFGETVEEQRKGLWRSIFGYFRGPKKTEVQIGTSAAKSDKPVEQARSLKQEEKKQGERDFDVNVDDLESIGYDSEDRSSDSQNLQQDSEIHMSLCLHAFKALEPTSYCEMKELFD